MLRSSIAYLRDTSGPRNIAHRTRVCQINHCESDVGIVSACNECPQYGLVSDNLKHWFARTIVVRRCTCTGCVELVDSQRGHIVRIYIACPQMQVLCINRMSKQKYTPSFDLEVIQISHIAI